MEPPESAVGSIESAFAKVAKSPPLRMRSSTSRASDSELTTIICKLTSEADSGEFDFRACERSGKHNNSAPSEIWLSFQNLDNRYNLRILIRRRICPG